MKLIYNGPKPERVVEFPIPFLSKYEKTGEVRFKRGQPTEIKAEFVEQMQTKAPEFYRDYFTVVEEQKGSAHVK